MDPRDYVKLLRRHGALLALCLTLAVVAGGVVVARATPMYESTVRLFVSVPASQGAAGAYQGGLFSAQRVKSYADLVTSEVVAERVVSAGDFGLSVGELAERTSSRVVPDTVLLDVSVRDPSAEQAQRLASLTAREFVELVTELERPAVRGAPLIRLSIVDRARLPVEPVEPRVAKSLLLAGMLGLMIGVAVATLHEILDTSVRSADEVAALTGVPGLAVLARERSNAPKIAAQDPQSRRIEAFRQLRTNLQYLDIDNAPTVITITSSIPDEGKTSTSVNLALALAANGQRVVLVEGDLRRPSVASYLGLVQEVGLTNVLLGSLPLDEALQEYNEHLFVLSSGPIPPNPAELLQTRATRQVLAELKQTMDFVLIDAPPLLPVTDAALLAARSDGAVLLVRYGRTRREQLQSALHALRGVDAKVLGTVLNMAPTKGQDAYAYGHPYAYRSTPDDERIIGSAGEARGRVSRDAVAADAAPPAAVAAVTDGPRAL